MNEHCRERQSRMRIEKRDQSFGDQVTADFRRTGHIGSQPGKAKIRH